jgi:hypothetical protein
MYTIYDNKNILKYKIIKSQSIEMMNIQSYFMGWGVKSKNKPLAGKLKKFEKFTEFYIKTKS